MPSRRRSRTRFSSAARRSRRSSTRPTASSSAEVIRADRGDGVEDAFERRRLEADHRHLGVHAPAPPRSPGGTRPRRPRTAPGSGSGPGAPPRARPRRGGRWRCRRAAAARTRSWISPARGTPVVRRRRRSGPARGRGLGWVVALVGSADELVAKAQGEDDLGGRRQERDDAHRAATERRVPRAPRPRSAGRQWRGRQRQVSRPASTRRSGPARPPCP